MALVSDTDSDVVHTITQEQARAGLSRIMLGVYTSKLDGIDSTIQYISLVSRYL